VTQVGFETEGVALIVFAAIALAGQAGMKIVPGWLKLVFLTGAIAVQIVLPLLMRPCCGCFATWSCRSSCSS
jgi:nucleobase:cation symporter-1, NCS1 family